MFLETSNIQNQDAYNTFYTSCMDRINHNITIQLYVSISILRVDLEQKSHLFRNKTDQCTCKETTGYFSQFVHEILLLSWFEASCYDNKWFFCDIVTCCRHIGKSPTTSQLINIDLLENLDDHEAKTKSFHNNVTNNDNIINTNNITFSVNNDHSMINDNMIHWNQQRIKNII